MKTNSLLVGKFLAASCCFCLVAYCHGDPTNCVPTPPGLVSWWRAETDAQDAAGTNHGTTVGNTTFAAGRVGQSFLFDGNGDGVRLGNPASLRLQDLTIEAWIKRASPSTVSYGSYGIGVVFSYGSGGYGLYLDGDGYPGLSKIDYNAVAPSFRVIDTNYHHLAVTKSGSTVVFFLDGAAYPVAAYNPGFSFSTDVGIGARGDNLDNSFLGSIDELAVYNRALTANEVQAIFNAGNAGKCFTLSPPAIILQPANQTVVVGETATFAVAALGTPPLNYQWWNGAAAISGGTSSSLTLTNVQPGDAGNYFVVVTNLQGSATSSNALLTVNPAPPCATPPAGLISWWQADGNALDTVGSNNGSLVGNAAYGPGRVGSTFVFDGNGDAVRLGNPASLQIQTFTIEAWVKRASTAIVTYGSYGNGVIFGYGSGGYGLYLDPSGHPALSQIGSSAVSVNVSITDMNYHHLAVTKTGSAVAFYVDGVAYPAAAYNPGFVFSTEVAIGAKGDSFDNSFLGAIDELAVYSRALSAPEIQSIYGAGVSGKCSAPSAPFVWTQPINQVATVGESATFSVVASGTSPLSYQWWHGDSAVSGGTSANLTLTNVQAGDAGIYFVVVTNLQGTATSSNALLTVNPVPPCATPPTGLISWWQADGNALDSVGGNGGSLVGNTAYGPGRVGSTFVFDGNGDAVRLGNPASLRLQDFTIEAWVKRGSVSVVSYGSFGNGVIFGYGSGGYGLYLSPNGTPALSKIGSSAVSPNVQIVDLNYHHLAVTKSGTVVVFYLDGVSFPAGAYNPGFVFSTEAALGAKGDTFDNSFLGSVDELAVYTRALTTTEVQSIFNAGVSGKCMVPIPPFFTTQPTNKTVLVGSTATLTASAGGSVPLNYQWQFNGTNLDGANVSSLTLSNVQFSQSGNYSVVVTNAAGATNSANALLTVVFPSAKVLVVSATGMAGGTVTVPIQLVANGNENAMGFSLNFSTQRLVFSSVTLGAGATNATPLFNTDDVSKGRLGVALALSLDATFAPGTQEVVRVEFTSAILQGGSPVATPISFGDQPTLRQLSDAQARPVSANYSNGVVTLLPTDLEGDVSPRPTGDRTNAITDWVQVGRFAARLDIAADGSEFQRADCAPRSNLGNGVINVVDWVQAGRYAAGLDPLTAVGGPTAEGGAALGGAGPLVKGGDGIASPSRKVLVSNAAAIQGLAVTLPVMLDSLGNENALGFSLNFDATRFTYSSASLGKAAAGATWNVNVAQAAAGKLGFTVMLPLPTHFDAGLREVAKVTMIPTSAAVGSNVVGFSNDPVSRAISDPFAIELAADYVPGSISVNPLPALLIALAGENVTLTWPDWATAFNLQTATNATVSGWTTVVAPRQNNAGSLSVTLPVAGETRFFRLQSP